MASGSSEKPVDVVELDGMVRELPWLGLAFAGACELEVLL